MSKVPYQPFGKAILRTPLYPFQGNNAPYEFHDNEIFWEALFLASPELCYIQDRHMQEGRQSLDRTLYKYRTRASVRCTPFGLFAGCSVCTVGNGPTEICLEPVEKYRKGLRFDLQLVDAVIRKIRTIPELKSGLKYYPNNTCYTLGDQLRYMECCEKGGQMAFGVSQVDDSQYLEAVIAKAKEGALIEDLVRRLAEMGIESCEAQRFVDEMIEAQLLVDELNMNATGVHPAGQVLNALKRIDALHPLSVSFLQMHTELTHAADLPIGNARDIYESLVRRAESEFQIKNKQSVIYGELFKPVSHTCLSSRLTEDLKEVIGIMCRFSSVESGHVLQQFISNFTERYDQQERPLLEVLDPDIGIGYGADTLGGGFLLDGLTFPGPRPENQANRWVEICKELSRELSGKACREIMLDHILSDNEPVDWGQCQNTLAVQCSIIRNDAVSPLVYVRGIGGSSALNLLGRFCHAEASIADLAQEIVSKEQELQESVQASIVHLAGARVGNVLFRPVLRPYEIPIYTLPQGKAIPLQDLTVSVRNGKIVLRSRKLGLPVLPQIDNAHNYRGCSNVVYRFLCDLQFQDKVYGLNIPSEVSQFDQHIPRIRYRNFILSREKWRIMSNIVKRHELDSPENLRLYCRRSGIPDKVLLCEHDNELLLNLDQDVSLTILAEHLKKKGHALLEEFLYIYDDTGVTDQAGNGFCNEFIIPYYKC